MAYLSLYRKYRPQTFEDILGQHHVSTTLMKAISEDRVAHAYLFTGPRGTGKTSTARILAKALNCEKGPTPHPCGKCPSCLSIADGSSMDVIEMDAASHSKVDETREILAGVPLASAGGHKKVYVIDEVHMLSTQAFNALLKTLEEPPSHVVFILATTEAHKVLPTIISRTQRFDFRRVSAEILESHLAAIAKSENIDAGTEALEVIARYSDGSVRDALSVLDQISSFEGSVGASDVERLLGERGEDVYVAMFEAIASSDVGGVFEAVRRQVAEGADLRQLAEGTLGHARSLLLIRTAPDAVDLLDAREEDHSRLAEQAQAFTPATLLRTIDLIWRAIVEMRNSPNHRLLFEVALVRAAAPDTDPSATGLLGRIERLERRLGIEGTDASPAEATAAPSPARPRPTPQPESQPAPRKARAARPTPPTVETESKAPPPSKRETAEPAAPAVTAAVGFGHVKDAWPATMQEVSQRSKTVWALLNPSSPLGFDDETLTVEVLSEFHEGEMSQERNRAVLGEALHAALGIRPPLVFTPRKKEESKSKVEDDADYESDTAEPVQDDPIELVRKGLKAEVVRQTGDQ